MTAKDEASFGGGRGSGLIGRLLPGRGLDVRVWLASVFLVLLILVAALAPLIAPYNPETQALVARLKPPFTTLPDGRFYLLGTDSLGRDLLTLLIYGARVSVTVGLATVALSGIIGIGVGVTAGYFRGVVDNILMRLVDIVLAFPSLLLALVIVFAMGGSFLTVIAALALTRWMIFARVSRALTLSVRQEPYIAAAETLGCTNSRIIWSHVLPNILSPLVVLAALEVSVIIPAEASLSFLGLGVRPPGTSWGLIIAEGRPYMGTSWWLVTLPGVAILMTTLSLNFLAVRLRAKSA